MSATASSIDPDSLTVKGYFNRLSDEYVAGVLNGSYEGANTAHQRFICNLIVQFEELWRRIGTVGAFSVNDDLDDYTTTALDFLWVPYILADLYQRFQESPGGPSGSSGMGPPLPSSISTATPQAGSAGMKGEPNQPQPTVSYDSHAHHEDGSPVTDDYAGEKTTHAVLIEINEANLRALSRQEALTRSHAWFQVFFEWLQNTGLMEAREIETFSKYLPDQRSLRIQLSRLCSELRQKLKESEAKVQYQRVKRRRMRELMAENGEAVEEGGGEEEELLRERALARLRWSGYDACHQLQLSARELAMLEAVGVEQRAGISAAYQRTLEAVRRGELSLGRHTYTILPGGMMMAGSLQNPQPLDPTLLPRGGGPTGGVLNSQAQNARSSAQLFRQQVRDELMVDRNPTTMTLEEFAEKEMAEVQRQMAEALEMQAEAEAENERLGPEGVEERQRKKDSAWQDWKDDHPAYGITKKGNYA
ncbi:unnamed protein product [Phytomonas sp. EM1]|nr:unnamed protein product [Phytomonas sp. EM1]|eukprot:CCW63370.1 unnamed protein product [Phytomonas sp. isolate EM1]